MIGVIGHPTERTRELLNKDSEPTLYLDEIKEVIGVKLSMMDMCSTIVDCKDYGNNIKEFSEWCVAIGYAMGKGKLIVRESSQEQSQT